jgi:S-adenosylhomocysteine hydrolase
MEQTRRGAKLLRATGALGPRFPVVNVAESRSKLELESPLIGESVARALDERLREAGGGLSSRSPVLVVGFGSVGAAVARALRARGVVVSVADADPRAAAVASADGFASAPLASALPRVGILVGCTGTEWFAPAGLASVALGEVALASASTADVEFRAANELPLTRLTYPAEAEECGPSLFREVHSSYALPTGPRHALLNGGFPCNFDGSIDPIPPRAIQLTRALILAGACSAVASQGATGLVPLPEALDHEIAEEFRRADVAW